MGWKSLKYSYQTALYWSEYVHSWLLERMVDFGIVGCIVVMGFVFFNLYAYRKALKYPDQKLASIVFIANATIFLHAMIDVDMEFPVIVTLALLNLAILIRCANLSYPVHLSKRIGGTLASLLLFAWILQLPLFPYAIYYEKTIQARELEQWPDILDYAQKGLQYFPFASSLHDHKAQAYHHLYIAESREELFFLALDSYQLAEKLNAFHPQNVEGKGLLFYANGNYQAASEAFEGLIGLDPLMYQNYVWYTQALTKRVQQGDSIAMQELRCLEQRIEKAQQKFSGLAYRLHHKPNLTMTEDLRHRIRTVGHF